jgi:hypothetical protein
VLQSLIATEICSSDVDFDGQIFRKTKTVVTRAVFIITNYIFPSRPQASAGIVSNSYTPKAVNVWNRLWSIAG